MDDSRATDQALPAGCGGVAAMSVAPNGAYVALACCDGRLRVMTSGEAPALIGKDVIDMTHFVLF